MDTTRIAEVLEKHIAWLRGEKDGEKADLSWANLREADLSRANLSGANMSWADLSWANLREANLSWADLSRANLSRANLSGANMHYTDLRGANLSGANLSEANMHYTDLRGANLSEANLDYSTWPLHCGSFGAKAGERLVAQLIAHVARLDISGCEESWVSEAMAAIKPYANKFRVYRNDVSEIKEA